MPLANIVTVNIILAPPPSSLAGFGIPLIIHTLTAPQDALFGANRTVTLTQASWPTVLAGVGITSSDQAFTDVQAMFSQDLAPTKAYLARRDAAVAYASTSTFTGGSDGTYLLTVTASLEVKTYTHVESSGVGTPTSVRDAVLALIALDTSTFWTALTSGADAIDFAGAAAGYTVAIAWTTSGGADTVNDVVSTAAVGIPDDLLLVNAQVSDYYMVVNGSILDTDIVVTAQTIEAQKRMHAYYTQDVDVPTTATDDVMSRLQDASFKRTFGLHRTAATDGSHAAWVGRCIPALPGQINWSHKTLSGITGTDYSLDTASYDNIIAKGGNVVELFNALNPPVSRTQLTGSTADGNQIDVIRGVDNVEATLIAAVFNLFGAEKVSYDNDGIAQVVGVSQGAIDDMVQQGVLQPVDSSDWTIPDITDATAAQQTAGQFPAITFVARALLSGNSAIINGTITVSV